MKIAASGTSNLSDDAGDEAAVCAPFAPTGDTLRTKLDAAIVAEHWEAVKVIGARLRELEREGAALHAARVRRR
jgi:hypothetical protein